MDFFVLHLIYVHSIYICAYKNKIFIHKWIQLLKIQNSAYAATISGTKYYSKRTKNILVIIISLVYVTLVFLLLLLLKEKLPLEFQHKNKYFHQIIIWLCTGQLCFWSLTAWLLHNFFMENFKVKKGLKVLKVLRVFFFFF